MGLHNFVHNISLGNSNKKLNDNDIDDLKNFINFKKNKKINKNFDFSKEVNLSNEFKCINWFKYTYNNYLSFIILKARNTKTFKTYYFHFKYFNYIFYKKSDIEQNNELREIYNYSKHKSLIYDIKSYIFKNALNISVQHYTKFNTILNYFKEIDNIFEDINNIEKNDIYLFKTNFYQNKNLSSCENGFMDIRVFYIFNEIEPSCTFVLDNFKLFKGLHKKNTYYINSSNVKNFFKNKVEIITKDVPRYFISFDIESDVNTARSIDSPENIITHCALEYFISSFYNIDYDKKILPFNFCLINKNYHYLTVLYKKKNELFSKNSIYYNNKDKLYYDIINKKIPDNLKKIISEEIINIKKKYIYLSSSDLEKNKKEFKTLFKNIIDKNIKYIFTDEIILIKTLFKFFHTYDTDYILTYNGHGYDFPQLGKRLSYLEKETVSKVFYLKSLYSNEKVYYSSSNNMSTNFSIRNMICNTPYFSVDLFNYVKKFYQNETSFSLKEISKNLFNIEAICVCRLITKKFYEYEIILLYNENIEDNLSFIKVLLSSNYCFINNVSYIISDKSEIINNENMYSIDVLKLVSEYKEIKGVKILKGFKIKTISEIDNNLNNDTNFTFENYKNYITKINLSKDDVEISSSAILEKISNLNIANYCIHDTLLCRHIFDKYLIKENIDIYSNLNVLSQSISLCYRNNTNINGYILKTCFKENTFLMKSKKISISGFTGGKVFEPKENFIKEAVMVFDFESLYPSIIIKYNISPECLILAVKTESIIEFNLLKLSIKEKFNEKDYTIVCNVDEKDKNNIKYNIVVFTKIYKDKSERYGFLNIMLQDLKKIRKQYKLLYKKYKKENNEYMSKHCDLIQNNIKLLMNCIYGLLGSEFFNFSCKFSSQCITSLGVKNITFLEQYLTDTKIYDNSFFIHNTNYFNDDIFTEDDKIMIYNPATKKNINLCNTFNIDYPYDHELSIKIIYGDTDSIMMILKNINTHPYILENKDQYEIRIINLISLIGNKINHIINNNILGNDGLNLEFENIILEMIIQSKKKYLGKSIEPLNIDSLPQIQDPSLYNFKFKEFNKGTSIKRRDICNFQKKLMVKFHKLLKNIIINNRYTDENINVYKIYKNVWFFIENEIKNILSHYLENKINISDFLISSSFTDNYKSEDNHIAVLIRKYNLTSKDQINKGDRFNYIFLKNQDEKTIEEIEKIKNNNSINLEHICKIISWKNIETKINDYKYIYDENLNFNEINKRICFEIYINKLISDILTLFPETNIIKNKIKESYTNFLSIIKNL